MIGYGTFKGLRPSYELVALFAMPEFKIPNRSLAAVSYTHLDVYKRQDFQQVMERMQRNRADGRIAFFQKLDDGDGFFVFRFGKGVFQRGAAICLLYTSCKLFNAKRHSKNFFNRMNKNGLTSIER